MTVFCKASAFNENADLWISASVYNVKPEGVVGTKKRRRALNKFKNEKGFVLNSKSGRILHLIQWNSSVL